MRASILLLVLALLLSVTAASGSKKDEDASSSKKDEDASSSRKDETTSSSKKDETASSSKKDETASSSKKDETASSSKKGKDTSSSKKVEDNWTFEGCFTLDESNSALWHRVMEGDYMTQGFCHDRCRAQSAYRYFGLESGDRCYCGVTVQAAAKVANARCTRQCKGNSRETCGGDKALQVFRITDQQQQQQQQQQQKKKGTPSDKGIRCSYDKSGGGNNLVCVANIKLDDILN